MSELKKLFIKKSWKYLHLFINIIFCLWIISHFCFLLSSSHHGAVVSWGLAAPKSTGEILIYLGNSCQFHFLLPMTCLELGVDSSCGQWDRRRIFLGVFEGTLLYLQKKLKEKLFSSGDCCPGKWYLELL